MHQPHSNETYIFVHFNAKIKRNFHRQRKNNGSQLMKLEVIARWKNHSRKSHAAALSGQLNTRRGKWNEHTPRAPWFRVVHKAAFTKELGKKVRAYISRPSQRYTASIEPCYWPRNLKSCHPLVLSFDRPNAQFDNRFVPYQFSTNRSRHSLRGSRFIGSPLSTIRLIDNVGDTVIFSFFRDTTTALYEEKRRWMCVRLQRHEIRGRFWRLFRNARNVIPDAAFLDWTKYRRDRWVAIATFRETKPPEALPSDEGSPLGGTLFFQSCNLLANRYFVSNFR